MILHGISPPFSQRSCQCTSNFENICNFPKYWDVLKYHMTDWSLFVLRVQICCTNSNCGADKWWTASILQLEKTSIILQVGELSKSINVWVLPKCFHWICWIQWQHFCKIGYSNLQPLVQETKMLPQSQQDMDNRQNL